MPIDLICYARDSLELPMRRRFEAGDVYCTALARQWSEGIRKLFRRLPNLDWPEH
jgi:putative proteasome-type protease